MKHGIQKVLVKVAYSRELSLLLLLERTVDMQLIIYVFYNGGSLVETLQYKMPAKFSLKTMTHAAYQGELFLCFGVGHPLYRFRIDTDALAQFTAAIEDKLEEKHKEIDAFDDHMGDVNENLRQHDITSIWAESMTSYAHTQMAIEKVREEKKEVLKDLFHFEALEWPVVAYSPDDLANAMASDPEEINDNLERFANDENLKIPRLLRTSVVAPFASRLWCFGSPINSHQILASGKGDFSDFDVAYPSLVHVKNPLSPLLGTFISETFDPVLWAVPFGEELLIGTTDGLYILKEGNRERGEFVKIHKELNMGVAPIAPVVMDRMVFFVEGNRKKISCLTYSREKGGYQVHAITSYADHLLTSGVLRLEAVRTPFNMLFVLLGDGHFIVFTHDADLKLLGWTQHYLGGDGIILDMCVMPTLKDDEVFFLVLRDRIEYLEVLKTSEISPSPTAIREATYLDCSSRFQDEKEIVIEKAVQSVIDTGEFYEELNFETKGYSLLAKQLHHQIDRDVENFDMNDFLIDGAPWDELPNNSVVKKESQEFLERYYKKSRKELLANIGRWSAFIQGMGELIRFPRDMSTQNFNSQVVLKKVATLREILDVIKNNPDSIRLFKGPSCQVTSKTRSHVNFNPMNDLTYLRGDWIGVMNDLLDHFVRYIDPFLKNIGLKARFNYAQSFVTHVNRIFLEHMAGFYQVDTNMFHQIGYLQNTDNDFFNKAFQYDLLSKQVFSTKSFIQWLKKQTEEGIYKETPFRDLDAEHKVFFLQMKIDEFWEHHKESVFIRGRNQFYNKNSAMADIILDVCVHLNLDVDLSLIPQFLKMARVGDSMNITGAINIMNLDLADQAKGKNIPDAEDFFEDDVIEEVEEPEEINLFDLMKNEPVNVSGIGSVNLDDEPVNVSGIGSVNLDDEEELREDLKFGNAEPIEGVNPREYEDWVVACYSRLSDIRNYIDTHYLLLSDQYISSQRIGLSHEKDTFRFFKYCFLDLKNMVLYKDLFKHVSLDTYTDLVQLDSGAKRVFTIPTLKFFPDDKLTLVGGNHMYEHALTIDREKSQIVLQRPLKTFSMGFNYNSVLKLFPFTFNDEIDCMNKRNVELSVKVYNTRDGWVEEQTEGGQTITHSLRHSILPQNHYNYHLADSGYLVKEIAEIISPPYRTGWINFDMKEPIKRDITFNFVVNTPGPASILKVSTKAQVLDKYKC